MCAMQEYDARPPAPEDFKKTITEIEGNDDKTGWDFSQVEKEEGAYN